MNLFLTFLNAIGSISSIISYPFVALPLIVVLVFAQTGREMSSKTKFFAWAFLAVGLVFYIVDIADRLGWTRPIINVMPLINVYDQVFINDRVPINGYSYNHCKFQNVQFVIGGPGRDGEINNSEFGTAYSVTSDNPTVQSAINVLNALGALNWPVAINGNIIAPYGQSSKFHGAAPHFPFTPPQ